MTKKSPLPQPGTRRQRISRELTEILTYAVTNSPATVVITDVEGRIEYVNRKFCKLTGYSPSEVLGKNASLLKSGLMDEKTYRTLWRHLKKGQSWTCEFHNRKKNGEHYWEQAAISPVRDEKGSICHYLKIAEDITQRKLLETDLRCSLEKLRLHEAHLKATCKQLESASRALKKSESKLKRLSQEDALTGLLNRRGFNTELRRARALAERQGHGIGILIIDLDHFKQINDHYGHAMGDHILKMCAKLLKSLLRASDLICRYGGDEIVIALPAADAETTRATARRILAAIQQHDFSKGSERFFLTVSIGAACGIPAEGQSLDKVLKMADRALYRVKRNGRNGMAFWPSGDAPCDAEEALTAAGDGAHSQPFRFVFHMLVGMLDAREKATGDHSKRVARLAGELALAMGLPPHQVELVKQGALLHDLGTIAVPDTILLKPGPLTPAERKIVKTHPQAGYDILKAAPEFRAIAEIVLSHQERYDGTGYPRKLKGLEICIGARIFAVVDAYDAMRAGRPYAAARSAEAALREIKRGRGTQFDPAVVDTFLGCQARLEAALRG